METRLQKLPRPIRTVVIPWIDFRDKFTTIKIRLARTVLDGAPKKGDIFNIAHPVTYCRFRHR